VVVAGGGRRGEGLVLEDLVDVEGAAGPVVAGRGPAVVRVAAPGRRLPDGAGRQVVGVEALAATVAAVKNVIPNGKSALCRSEGSPKLSKAAKR